MYKKSLLLIISFIFIFNNCYSQAYLGKTISQVREEMKKDHPNVKIEIVNNDSGGKSLFQILPDVQHIAICNSKGICNLEKMYPTTNVAAARILFLIKGVAYTNYHNYQTDIEVYKIRIEGVGIIQVDFLVTDKGYYVFESYFLNKYGKRNLS